MICHHCNEKFEFNEKLLLAVTNETHAGKKLQVNFIQCPICKGMVYNGTNKN